MGLITLTQENLESEHICYAISGNKNCQALSRRTWSKERLDGGLIFVKCNVRGKHFIEYVPAEVAWAPMGADRHMCIGCLQVSGQFKGQGYSSLLSEECTRDSKEKGRKGLVVLSSKKKVGLLSNSGFLRHKGFETMDRVGAFFELTTPPLWKQEEKPRFWSQMKDDISVSEKGLMLYHTNQCPLMTRYVPILEETARRRGVEMKVIRVETAKQTQDAPSPSTTFSLFHNGELVTHEILSEKKFEKILDMC